MRNHESYSQPNGELTPEVAPEQADGNLFSDIKEKAVAFVRHKQLRLKGYFDRLDPGEFEELLSHDFEEHVQENPVINGVFSPEAELDRIKSLPKEQRREALAGFKENLARQRKAWANCRLFIERSIEFYDEIPREGLMEIVEKFGAYYGFTEEQKLSARELIDQYYKHHQKVREMRQKFPNNADLVKELTGLNFDTPEEFDVSVGPMTIDIETNEINGGRLYENSENPVIGYSFGAFASQSAGNDPTYYIVLNNDWRKRAKGYGDPSGKQMRQHEYEHQKHKLFRAVFEKDLIGDFERDYMWRNYIQEQDPERKKITLEDFFRREQEVGLDRAKDEITAYLAGGRRLEMLLVQLVDLFFNKQGNYDYLAYLRDYAPMKTDQLFQEVSEKILVQEYRSIIEKAVKSLGELINKGKYSSKEAIALLTDKSLSDWPKTIERLLVYDRNQE